MNDLMTGDRVLFLRVLRGGFQFVRGLARWSSVNNCWYAYDVDNMRGAIKTQFVLRQEDEGVFWARGWDTPESIAMKAAASL